MTSTYDDLSRFNFVPGPPGPFIVGGEGSSLITADGRRILDAAGGAIVANIGHGRREVADAVHAAMATGGYVIPLWPTPHRLELLDRLIGDWLPDGFDHVFFTSGGSESADSAIRLARAYQVSRGSPCSLEGRRAPSELPRHDRRHALGRQPPRPAGRLRTAAARLPQGAVGRSGSGREGDRAGGSGDDRRVHLRADHRARRAPA